MAQTTTGKGVGASGKFTTKELSVLANSLNIVEAGTVEATNDIMVNPPSPMAEVVFTTPLPGGYENYVILVTTISGGKVYVSQTLNNDDGNFYLFRMMPESECTCMYTILKKGIRPSTV